MATCLLLITLSGISGLQAQSKPEPLVTIEDGDLPIILSAPHGGRGGIPGVPVRQGEGVEKFNSKADSGTAELTEQLAEHTVHRCEDYIGDLGCWTVGGSHRHS